MTIFLKRSHATHSIGVLFPAAALLDCIKILDELSVANFILFATRYLATQFYNRTYLNFYFLLPSYEVCLCAMRSESFREAVSFRATGGEVRFIREPPFDFVQFAQVGAKCGLSVNPPNATASPQRTDKPHPGQLRATSYLLLTSR